MDQLICKTIFRLFPHLHSIYLGLHSTSRRKGFIVRGNCLLSCRFNTKYRSVWCTFDAIKWTQYSSTNASAISHHLRPPFPPPLPSHHSFPPPSSRLPSISKWTIYDKRANNAFFCSSDVPISTQRMKCLLDTAVWWYTQNSSDYCETKLDFECNRVSFNCMLIVYRCSSTKGNNIF